MLSGSPRGSPPLPDTMRGREGVRGCGFSCEVSHAFAISSSSMAGGFRPRGVWIPEDAAVESNLPSWSPFWRNGIPRKPSTAWTACRRGCEEPISNAITPTTTMAVPSASSPPILPRSRAEVIAMNSPAWPASERLPEVMR